MQLTILFSVEYPPEDPNSVIFGRELTVMDGRNQEQIWFSPLKNLFALEIRGVTVATVTFIVIRPLEDVVNFPSCPSPLLLRAGGAVGTCADY